MDELGRITLRAEITADVDVIKDAARTARARLGKGSACELEAAAFQLVRCYNCLEQMGMRVAKAFENHIDDDRGWHVELLRRLSLSLPEIRPAFFPKEALEDLQTLRGFRHVVVHAYDLVLKKDKIEVAVGSAERVAAVCPELVERFFENLP